MASSVTLWIIVPTVIFSSAGDDSNPTMAAATTTEKELLEWEACEWKKNHCMVACLCLAPKTGSGASSYNRSSCALVRRSQTPASARRRLRGALQRGADLSLQDSWMVPCLLTHQGTMARPSGARREIQMQKTSWQPREAPRPKMVTLLVRGP